MIHNQTNLRYIFHTINAGIKYRSERVLTQILNNIDRKGIFLNKFHGLEVGKMAHIQGKLGKVSLINIVGKRLLVWLEIPLTRFHNLSTGVCGPRTIHYGIEVFVK